ncbi:MAG: hypothetical protein ACRC9N_12050 [Aeromonas sp.]
MNPHPTPLITVDCLRPAMGQAHALHYTCRSTVEPIPCAVLADLLIPLAELVNELEVVCTDSQWQRLTEQNNRYLSAVVAVLNASSAEIEPCWLADLLIPLMVSFDVAERLESEGEL